MPTPKTQFGKKPDTRPTTGYYVEDRLGSRVAGPFYHEETAREKCEELPEGREVVPDEAEFFVDTPMGELNDLYNEVHVNQLAHGEGTIEVDLYRAEDSRVYDDPVDTLVVNYLKNGYRVRFWVESEGCECCESRPEQYIDSQVGTHVPFRNSFRNFAQYVINGTAPRQFDGGEKA